MAATTSQTKQKEPKKERSSSKKFPFQSPKGMHDVLPDDFAYVEKIEKALKKVAGFYGFDRIEPPLLEDVNLFERGTGTTSEVVQKQMFTLKAGRGENDLALRPEMTPGVFRAYIQNGLNHTLIPGKFYYEGPMFRYEQPQAGRFRQFHQLGFEIINSGDPIYDAQIITASYRILDEIRLKDVMVKVNSIGCKACRVGYVKKLRDYYKDKVNKLCKDCQRRYKENPLRLLDCKNEQCQPFKEEVPLTLDSLCASCKKHFKLVLEVLDDTKLPYSVDPHLVRGLDYYTHTVFELFIEGLGFAVGGGGRYDYLAEMLSAPKMPAVGVALGIERLVEAMKAQNAAPAKPVRAHVFMVYMGDEAKKKAFSIMEEFYEAGIPVHEAFSRESLKAQLKVADKEGAELALILGQREVFEEVIIMRNMKTGAQETIALKKVVETVKKRL